ncbi:MAG TPA: signal peptidase II [Candidatus Eisenbergiella merdigallinarum]|uniref:Lipoprotein signal peptidase n=1 Tax=Candidatus Eisenbergiella merdigallinarum TaxID=2838552 RepID=A0A9D2MPI8_9FIRM|nr:signal peptidase II [Candidatus Eisenbergiella merdigallinarum]
MKRKISKLFPLDLCIAAAGVFVDQLTKYLATAFLKDQPAVPLIPGVLELRYLENRGAAFGMLQNQKIFFVIMTCLILAFCLYALIRMPSEKKYVVWHVTGGLLMAGALGNFIDRLRLDYVVDFIYIRLIDFPIFNVADMYITCVCAIALILAFFGHDREEDFSFLKPKKKGEK